jgi:UDP-N-acetylmuramate dehydrogenase
MVDINDIRMEFRGHIAVGEPMSKYTSLRVGGPADLYLEPLDKEDLIRLVHHLEAQGIKYIVIGNGSNLLVSDEGIRAAVINLEKGLSKLWADDTTVFVEAGVMMARYVDFCIQRGLGGMEMLAGIPGTMGGAIVMNAGAYGGEISNHIVDVEVLRQGRVVRVKREDAGFAYRRSNFASDIVLHAQFKFPRAERSEMMKRRRELLLKRGESQPLDLPNSGSVFKNPEGSFAAKLIDEAGLKGQQIGGAKISEKHGNFIVNLGNAKAADILELVKLVRKTVAQRFNVKLDLEVKLIGFPESAYKEVCA